MAENFYLTNIYGEIQHFSERTRVYEKSDLNKNWCFENQRLRSHQPAHIFW